MNLTYYYYQFFNLPALEKKLLLRGLLFSAFVSLLIQLLPIKYYIILLKTKPKFLISESEKPPVIQMVIKVTRRITRFSPWHCNCLIKSMVIKNLLDSLGVNSNVAFSLNKTKTELLLAHAYVKLDSHKSILMRKNFFEVLVVH